MQAANFAYFRRAAVNGRLLYSMDVGANQNEPPQEMNPTRGYIYFAIKTEDENLDLADFDKYLRVKSTKFDKMYSRGPVPKCTIWTYSTDELINPFYYEVIEGLINELLPYKDNFKTLKNEYADLHYVLEVVIYLGDETPGLNFSRAVLDFLDYVGAEIDCDIYNKK